MAYLCSVEAELAHKVSALLRSYCQRLPFFGQVLIDEGGCSAGFVLLLVFLILLNNFLDSDLLLADSKHITFFDHILFGREAFDDDPRLLFGLRILAYDIEVALFLRLLLVVGLNEVDDCINACVGGLFLHFVGDEFILAVGLEDPCLLCDVVNLGLQSAGLHSIVVEIRVGLLPRFAEDLSG